jgi:hypothetical protein
MSTAYVIPGIDYETLLIHTKDNDQLNITKVGNDYKISLTATPTKYNLKKRAALASMAKIPPDYIPKGGIPTIFLRIVPDKENSWFDGYSTSISNPEVILAVIVDILKNIGINTAFYSEHDKEFWNISDTLEESFTTRLSKALFGPIIIN